MECKWSSLFNDFWLIYFQLREGSVCCWGYKVSISMVDKFTDHKILLFGCSCDFYVDSLCNSKMTWFVMMWWIFFGEMQELTLPSLQQLNKTYGCDNAQKCSWYSTTSQIVDSVLHQNSLAKVNLLSGTKDLAEILSERESIAHTMQVCCSLTRIFKSFENLTVLKTYYQKCFCIHVFLKNTL